MLMCDLLGLTPAPNNGSRANYEDILDTSSSVNITVSKLPVILSFMSFIIVSFFAI